LPGLYSGNFFLQIFVLSITIEMSIKKIYFAGSIRGGREDAGLYAQIIGHLKQFGIVLTEHVGYPAVNSWADEQLSDQVIYERDMQWLHSCDAVVAEITTISMGVGYELGQAVASGKKVLCLYRSQSGRRLSAMIAGCPAMRVVYYTEPAEAISGIDLFLNQNL
jgi:2'-deoxynucleoside 5'-phosphate N-hydrolase